MISVFWRLCFETVAFLVVASLVFFVEFSAGGSL